MKKMMIVLTLVVAALLAACDTQGTRNEPESAQNLLPNLANYTATNADNLVDTLTVAAGGASAATGNIPLAAGIARAEAVAQCLQDTGSVASNYYVESRPANVVPNFGAALVVNQTRVEQNLLACITRLTQGEVSAQAVQVEPCVDSGSFTFNGDTISYVYIGVGDNICQLFGTHFNSLQASNPS